MAICVQGQMRYVRITICSHYSDTLRIQTSFIYHEILPKLGDRASKPLTFVKHDAWRIQITYSVQTRRRSIFDERTCLKHLPHSAQRDALQPSDILANGLSPRHRTR